ncbi:hypothetical protein ABIB58_003021 [Brevundimonas sp. UYEF29]
MGVTSLQLDIISTLDSDDRRVVSLANKRAQTDK